MTDVLTGPGAAGPASRRPRNRRQLIIDAAGRVFNERGYHAASLEEIAARVGITAPALYRHFPNKYAMFAECTAFMADGLLQALDELPPDADAAQVLRALARVTIAHRATGGVYRWEARYLQAEDRLVLRGKFARIVDRVTAVVPAEPSGIAADLRAAAALGAIGSITIHHTRISPARAERLLVQAASRVIATAPPAGDRAVAAVLGGRPVPHTRRAEILAAAIALFARDGFANVTMGHLAESVGIAPSAIYRHFPGKVDILAAACVQAAGILSAAVEQALAQAPDGPDALRALATAYVAYSFEHRALTSVAEAELVGLPPELAKPLVASQRDHIAIWDQHLRAVRPELDERQRRALVHAAFGVVVEAGRRLHWEDTAAHRTVVEALVVSALGLP